MGKWILIQGVLALFVLLACLVLHSCNDLKESDQYVKKGKSADTIAYTLSNHKIKTLRIQGEKVVILENNDKVHVHNTKK